MKKLFFVITLSVMLFSFLLTPVVYAQGEIDWEKKLTEMRKEIKEKGYSFTVDYNPICEYDLKDLCGFKSELGPLSGIEDAKATDQREFNALRFKLPSRYTGYYTPVKDQGYYCGSCWAFCMAGAVEGLMKKIMSTDEDTSEQWLVDCNPWGWDCDGGFINYNMYITDGSPSETCYPYYGDDYLPCDTSCTPLYFIYDWDWVTNPYVIPPVDRIKQAIMRYGSVSVGIIADNWFQAYSGGVFDHCASGYTNHCVVLCGWDDSLGPSGVWLLKNSWGTSWGGVDIDGSGTVDPDELGFMWIIYGCSKVGESAAYPIPYFGG